MYKLQNNLIFAVGEVIQNNNFNKLENSAVQKINYNNNTHLHKFTKEDEVAAYLAILSAIACMNCESCGITKSQIEEIICKLNMPKVLIDTVLLDLSLLLDKDREIRVQLMDILMDSSMKFMLISDLWQIGHLNKISNEKNCYITDVTEKLKIPTADVEKLKMVSAQLSKLRNDNNLIDLLNSIFNRALEKILK